MNIPTILDTSGRFRGVKTASYYDEGDVMENTCTSSANSHGSRNRGGVRSLLSAVAFLVILLPACDGLLDVDLPTRIPADELDNSAMGMTLVLSAQADFECAYANYVVATGLLTDELRNSTGWIAPRLWDQRLITANDVGSTGCTATGPGEWRPLQTARVMAEFAYDRLSDWGDDEVTNRSSLMARAAALAGFSHVLLGEGFCEAAVDGGPLLSRDDMQDLARDWFSSALQHAQTAGDDEIRQMAAVGMARASLSLGDVNTAMQHAESIAEGFVWEATYSGATQRRRNRVHKDNHSERWVSVEAGFWNLEVDGVPDPRVPVDSAGVLAQDGITELWLQQKYPSESSGIPLASWEEAQLIIAEIAGGSEGMDAINAVREFHDLPLVTQEPDDWIDLVIEERRRTLFLTGHRMKDILRFERLDFPSEPTHKGVPRGTTTCLPLPQVERDNNPNL